MSRCWLAGYTNWTRALLRRAAALFWYYSGAFALWARWRAKHGPAALLVPMYHRIRTGCDRTKPPILAIERGTRWSYFVQHVGVYRRYGTLTTAGAGAAWLASPRAQGVRVAVTFDDAYRDILPAVRWLLAQGAHCTVYPVVEAAGGRLVLWWDQLAALARDHWPSCEAARRLPPVVDALIRCNAAQRQRALHALFGRQTDRHIDHPEQLYLTVHELRDLSKAGIEVGGHTATHVSLPFEHQAVVRRELARSLRFARQLSERTLVSLAYPNGLHSPTTRACARSLGFCAAVTTDPGANAAGADPFRLRRIPVGDEPGYVVALQVTFYDLRDVVLPWLLHQVRSLLVGRPAATVERASQPSSAAARRQPSYAS